MTELTAVQKFYATGRRKEASARVYLSAGTGKITVNGKPYEQYFNRPVLHMVVRQPLELTQTLARYDVDATISGGGENGQAGALRHGISRALTLAEPALRTALKKQGFLTRDPRMKERKKYGRKGARRRFQYTKR